MTYSLGITNEGFTEKKQKTKQKNLAVLGDAVSVLGMELKRGLCVFWLCFDIDLRSVTSMESSRQALSNDMVEHRPILKNNQNTYYTRFSCPKQE